MKEWFILGLTIFNSLMIIAVSGQVTTISQRLFGSSRAKKSTTAESEQRSQSSPDGNGLWRATYQKTPWGKISDEASNFSPREQIQRGW